MCAAVHNMSNVSTGACLSGTCRALTSTDNEYQTRSCTQVYTNVPDIFYVNK